MSSEKQTKDDPQVNVETRSIMSTATTLVGDEDRQRSAAGSSSGTHEAIPNRFDKNGKPLAHPALKWGRTPQGPFGDDFKATDQKSKLSEEEQAKLRAKGINPDLKAEMDEKVYSKGRWKLNLATMLNIK